MDGLASNSNQLLPPEPCCVLVCVEALALFERAFSVNVIAVLAAYSAVVL